MAHACMLPLSSSNLMAPASLRPASDLIISLLNDVLVHYPSCGRDMRTGVFVGHECTSSLTKSMAADVLRHVVPNSPPDMSAWSGMQS